MVLHLSFDMSPGFCPVHMGLLCSAEAKHVELCDFNRHPDSSTQVAPLLSALSIAILPSLQKGSAAYKQSFESHCCEPRRAAGVLLSREGYSGCPSQSHMEGAIHPLTDFLGSGGKGPKTLGIV